MASAPIAGGSARPSGCRRRAAPELPRHSVRPSTRHSSQPLPRSRGNLAAVSHSATVSRSPHHGKEWPGHHNVSANLLQQPFHREVTLVDCKSRSVLQLPRLRSLSEDPGRRELVEYNYLARDSKHL